MVICPKWDADLHVAQLMPLPLTVSCFSKIQIGFILLVLAHPGSPGKRAVKRVCVCVCVRNKIGITGLAFRPHHLHAVHRCTLFLLILHIAWPVCWTHRWALQNIWIDQDAVWGRMCWLKKPCDRSGVHWHHPMDTMNNICTGMMWPYVRLLCHLLTFIRAYNMAWCCGE